MGEDWTTAKRTVIERGLAAAAASEAGRMVPEEGLRQIIGTWMEVALHREAFRTDSHFPNGEEKVDEGFYWTSGNMITLVGGDTDGS